MSIRIHHFAVHQLVLKDDSLAIEAGTHCLHPSPALEQLCHELHSTFNAKPAKGVGHFQSNEHAFSLSFNEWLTQQTTSDDPREFHRLTLDGSNQLLNALIATGMVETGFLLFAHYEFLATEYLMITLLNTKQHIEVAPSLELNAKEHLDLAKMQLAAKIDITDYRVDAQRARYISFIKGRMGRKVSDFFMQFIGCEEQVDTKQQNKMLLNTVDDYLQQEPLDKAEKQAYRDNVKDYMQDKVNSGQNVIVKELAQRLPTDMTAFDNFNQYIATQEVPVDAEFSPDPSAVRQLSRFSGQGGGISLAFDRKLLGERVHYDVDNDTLTLQGVPPNLKDQLMRALQSSVEE